jgi:hypothetical protein
MPHDVPAALGTWLEANLDASGPFTWMQLTSGNSNFTYLLQADGFDAILRRPPEATIDPRARAATASSRPRLPAPWPTQLRSSPTAYGTEGSEVRIRSGALLRFGQGSSLQGFLNG